MGPLGQAGEVGLRAAERFDLKEILPAHSETTLGCEAMCSKWTSKGTQMAQIHYTAIKSIFIHSSEVKITWRCFTWYYLVRVAVSVYRTTLT